jgi:hypothetical protein
MSMISLCRGWRSRLRRRFEDRTVATIFFRSLDLERLVSDLNWPRKARTMQTWERNYLLSLDLYIILEKEHALG